MTTPARLDTVRGEIRSLLQQSKAFGELPATDRQRIAKDLVKVTDYLADPEWLDASKPARAEALKGSGVEDLRKGIDAQSKDIRRNDFEAAAVKQGVEAFDSLVKTVDFPAFVSGLVSGVFNAVVDASIQQMRAYGELLAAAAKSVDQFAMDHTNDDQARNRLVQRYPSALTVRREGGSAKLAMRDDYDGDLNVGADYGVADVDLEDPDGERKLLAAVRHEMAAQNQQMMATMVLLGIHRIVITNGRINAKVVFDIRASDEAKRHATASKDTAHALQTQVGYSGGIMGSIFGGPSGSLSSQHSTRVSSAVDDTSESKAELKAQLTGDVRLNFKSETFPLEKLADSVTIGNLNQRADPNIAVARQRASGAPAQTTPTPSSR